MYRDCLTKKENKALFLLTPLYTQKFSKISLTSELNFINESEFSHAI